MAATDYGVKRNLILHNVFCRPGRLIRIDSADPIAVALLAKATIAAKTSETIYDEKADTAPGVPDASALTTYTVTASGAGRILYNGGTTKLAQGNTLSLDSSEDTAKFLLAKGWIV